MNFLVTRNVTRKFRFTAIYLSIAGSLCVSTFLHAQVKNADANPNTSNLPTQRVGADDLVSIQVYDSPELTRTERVGPDGMLRLPLLTKPVQAAGLFPNDIEDELAQELKTEGILVRPIVSVTVSEYQSRPISVVGAVHHPITFQAYANVTLLDAITRAEGLSDTAGPEILVTRTGNSGGAQLVQRIPVKDLIDRADPTMDLKLVGGEEIRVPEGGRVFVVGNVKKPGAIQVHDINELSVLRVISQAEGILPYSGKEAFILRHGDSPKNEIAIPLDRIMARKSPDVPLMANDVLYVPESKSKKNTAKILETAAAFGMGTISGLLIFKH